MQVILREKNFQVQIFLVAAMLCSAGCAPIAPVVIERKIEIRERENEVTVREESVRASDGTALHTVIFVPDIDTKVPTILIRAPLPDDYKSNLTIQGVGRVWGMRGYAVVIQGTRGYFGSEGTRLPFLSERADGLATLEWLRTQPFYNGKIYTWGSSYFGYTQWQIADQPDLAGMFIQIAGRDWFPVLYNDSGMLALESALFWGLREGEKVPSIEQIEELGRTKPLLSIVDTAAKGEILGAFLRNHLYNDFWKQANSAPDFGTVDAPALFLGGWYDPCLAQQIDDFEDLRVQGSPKASKLSRLVIGPWSHAYDLKLPERIRADQYRPETIERALPWFDSLQADDSEAAAASKYEIYVLGRNEWRTYDSWPPPKISINTYLLSHEKLVKGPSTGECAADSFQHDLADPVPSRGGRSLGESAGIAEQDSISTRPDVLAYTSEAMTEETEIAGKIDLTFTAAFSGPSADFVATVIDVFPDGDSYNIVQEAVRLNRSKGERQRISITFPPIHRALFPGHRLRLLIAGSSYPIYELNPLAEQITEQKIKHGRCAPAELSLPVVRNK